MHPGAQTDLSARHEASASIGSTLTFYSTQTHHGTIQSTASSYSHHRRDAGSVSYSIDSGTAQIGRLLIGTSGQEGCCETLEDEIRGEADDGGGRKLRAGQSRSFLSFSEMTHQGVTSQSRLENMGYGDGSKTPTPSTSQPQDRAEGANDSIEGSTASRDFVTYDDGEEDKGHLASGLVSVLPSPTATSSHQSLPVRRLSLAPLPSSSATSSTTPDIGHNSSSFSSSSTTRIDPSLPTTTSPSNPRFSLHSPSPSLSSLSSSNPLPSPPSDWGSNFWCIVSDPSHPSHTFFANPSTGECRWTLPSGSLVLPPNPDGEWWELWDERSGRAYYFHTQTKETRWDRPRGLGRGIVIPMQAVQRSIHVTSTFQKEEKGWEKRLSRSITVLDVREEKEMVTTALRPRTRTKSAPKVFRSQTTKGDEVVLKARRSIVMRDQKALTLARSTSTHLFRSETSHAPAPPRPKRSKRPATSPTCPSFRFGHSTSTYPFSLHRPEPHILGISEETAAVARMRGMGEVRRLGKGLAYDPNGVCIPRRKSLPFISTKKEKEAEVVRLPRTVAQAIVGSSLRIGLHHEVHEEERGEKKRTKLRRLRLKSWAALRLGRCGSLTSSEDSVTSISSWGNL